MPDRQQLEAAIAAQEGLRGTVPDDIVDIAVAVLRRQLDQADAGAPRRRQATVLFADVSGFTAMAEHLDAEVLAGIMNDLWAAVDVALVDHGARIDKHIGDAVMAVWGADTTREDDPERAVRAGLALHEAVLGLRETRGLTLAMRVGISTGPVLIGAVGRAGETTTMGDTVNLASRLEDAAPLGGVLISSDTYQQVRGLFTVEAVANLTVKGKSGPVPAYLVLAVAPSSLHPRTRGLDGTVTRMVGREAELAVLTTAFADLLARRRPVEVRVIGDAGVGKSRLASEFEHWLGDRAEPVTVLAGRARPSGESTPLGVLRDLVERHCGIGDRDPPAVVATKLRRAWPLV